MPTIQHSKIIFSKFANNSADISLKNEFEEAAEEFFAICKTEKDFAEAIEVHYWGDPNRFGEYKKELVPICKKCDSDNVTRLKIPTIPNRFQCKDCRGQFNVLKDTPFFRSKIPLKSWFLIYYYQNQYKTVEEISKLYKMKKRDVIRIIKKNNERDWESSVRYIYEIWKDYIRYKDIYHRHHRRS